MGLCVQLVWTSRPAQAKQGQGNRTEATVTPLLLTPVAQEQATGQDARHPPGTKVADAFQAAVH